ncbi:MAG: methionine--tRNA ligase [Gemmatimonadales bacterium]
MSNKFYITTAIDYSNGEPHLGHAYEKIGADCIARYRRLRGQQVHFVIGMDEHGQKVAQTAEETDVDPYEWVDAIAEKFRATWTELSISNTDFIRTTEARHRRSAQELLGRIQDAGFISRGTYSGYYCVGCESFKQDKDLVDGSCPLHPTREISWLEEPNYFFKLGSFRNRLLEFYKANYEDGRDFVRPVSKFNEIRNVVAEWDDDYGMSASRARVPWGIPWPGDNEHVIYVWFEAVINYLTATGFPDAGYEEMWPADVHIIGPDILRFHAAIWPAMLMAANIPIPRCVWCHGWINTSGARFSKSTGVTLTLRDAIDRHGPDALRYFLLREIPWDADGNFTWERFDTRYTSELADGYGNLASRILAMIDRYLGGHIPAGGDETRLDRTGDELVAQYRDAMDAHLLHEASTAAWLLVSRANQFVEESAPWTLAKQERHDELRIVMASLARALSRITVMAWPFMPNKTQLVWQALGRTGEIEAAKWEAVEAPQVAGVIGEKLSPLFPKPSRNTR